MYDIYLQFTVRITIFFEYSELEIIALGCVSYFFHMQDSEVSLTWAYPSTFARE